MTYRIVQKPTDPSKPAVVCYLVGAQCDADLRAALPGVGIVATDQSGVAETPAGLRAALALIGATAAPPVLVGFSAGCQAPRALLHAGVEVSGVVCLDGTAGAWPTRRPSDLDAWQALAARARRGDALFVLTCTLQRYTAHVPPPQGPFAPTSIVVSEIVGDPTPATIPAAAHPLGAYPGGPVWEHHDGELHAFAYAGTDCDAAAHIAQQRVVMPDLLRAYVAPFLSDGADLVSGILDASQAIVAAAASIPESFARLLETTGVTLPERLLGRALLDLAAGVHEEGGHNDGPRVRGMLATVGCAPPANWCAAAVSTWLREAERDLGTVAPIKACAGAKGLMAELQKLDRWTGVGDLRAKPELARPGSIVVWHRGAPGAWTGHVGVVERLDGDTLVTVEGNSGPAGDRVARMRRPLSDPNLLGVGWVG